MHICECSHLVLFFLEYASRLGDARSEDEREEEQKRLISLVDAF